MVAAFGLDERTVAAWQARAGGQARRVHEHAVETGQAKVDENGNVYDATDPSIGYMTDIMHEWEKRKQGQQQAQPPVQGMMQFQPSDVSEADGGSTVQYPPSEEHRHDMRLHRMAQHAGRQIARQQQQ